MEPRIIKGRYASAVVYVVNLDPMSEKQIQTLCDAPFVEGEVIRVMPDAHAGKGCVIGYTQTIHSGKVCPSLVGVDISCGMLCIKLGVVDIDFKRFDEAVHATVPTGTDIHETKVASFERLTELKCFGHLRYPGRLEKGLGTLGGGNHFIELDKDDEDNIYLVIHTGSRNLGKQVADIYQKQAVKNMSGWDKLMEKQAEMIEEYKAEGRRAELQEAIRELHNSFRMQKPPVPAELCWLEGQPREDYLHDMRLCQRWAQINRGIIMNLLVEYLRAKGNISCTPEALASERFESVHNYIGDDGIIRKGAISASTTTSGTTASSAKEPSPPARERSASSP